MKQGQSVQDLCRSLISQYAAYVREKWLDAGDKGKDLDVDEIEKEVEPFWNAQTMRLNIKELALGYIWANTVYHEREILTKYQVDYGIDAARSSLRFIFGTNSLVYNAMIFIFHHLYLNEICFSLCLI